MRDLILFWLATGAFVCPCNAFRNITVLQSFGLAVLHELISRVLSLLNVVGSCHPISIFYGEPVRLIVAFEGRSQVRLIVEVRCIRLPRVTFAV